MVAFFAFHSLKVEEEALEALLAVEMGAVVGVVLGSGEAEIEGFKTIFSVKGNVEAIVTNVALSS